MKINGSLVFDASSASEVQNLRLQKITSLPAIETGDVGRLVYNTNTNIIYVGTNVGSVLSWVPLATGGDASALLAEVDRIEGAMGLNTDGSFNAASFTGNLAGQTSYVGLINTLQSLAAANASAISQEVTDRGTAITGVTTALTAETTRATGAETTLTTNLAAEVTRAQGAETQLTTDLAAETTRATSAEGVLTTNLGAEVSRATAAEGVLTTSISTEATTARAAEVANANAIIAEAGTARDAEAANAAAITAETERASAAELVLTNGLTSEASTARAAEGANATAITAETTRATAAEASIAADLAAEVNRAGIAENAIKADMDARLQGLAWKNPVRVATSGNVDLAAAASGYDGVTLVANDRVLVKGQTNPAENGIYVFHGAGQALTRAADMDLAGEFNATTVYVTEGDTNADLGFTQTGEIANVGTDPVTFVQFAGAGSVTAGAGMTQNGNVLNVVAADGSITVTADAIQVSSALQTSISDNTAAIATETSRATAAEGVLTTNLAAEVTNRGTAIDTEHQAMVDAVAAEATRATTAEGVLRTDLAAEVARAGSAESALAADLADAVASIAQTDADTNAAIAAETTRATGIEDGLRSDVTTLQGRATTENTERIAADAALNTRVDDEVARATAAEAATTARISKMYFLYTGTANTTHAVAHNLGQMYCNVTVVDGDNNVVIPESIVFNDANNLTVTFNSAIDCKVVVMGLAAA